MKIEVSAVIAVASSTEAIQALGVALILSADYQRRHPGKHGLTPLESYQPVRKLEITMEPVP